MGTAPNHSLEEIVAVKSQDPVSRIVSILFVVGGASEIGLVLMKRSGSGLQVAYYVDVASMVLIAAGVVLLALLLRASRGAFRSTTIWVTCGFALQLGYLVVLYYYERLASPRYLPIVSIADLLFLFSYVFWIVGTAPYLGSYVRRMSRGSEGLLALCGGLIMVASYFSGAYWYDSAMDSGYDSLGTLATLVHAIAPFMAMLFLSWVALLYLYDRHGRKVFRVAYVYFLIPVGLVALANIVDESSYVWGNGSLPGQYSDAIFLLAGSTLIAAAASISRPALRELAEGRDGDPA